MSKTIEICLCPFCGEPGEEREERGWFACSNNECPAWHLQAELEDWNKRAAPAVERQEPVDLQHMAVAENGKLRWMTGRKMQDCELYALPYGSAINFPLYTSPPAPVAVVLPTTKELRELVTKAAREADLIPGANFYAAAELAAGALFDKIKEMNK